jgi:hypothetical protein
MKCVYYNGRERTAYDREEFDSLAIMPLRLTSVIFGYGRDCKTRLLWF